MWESVIEKATDFNKSVQSNISRGDLSDNMSDMSRDRSLSKDLGFQGMRRTSGHHFPQTNQKSYSMQGMPHNEIHIDNENSLQNDFDYEEDNDKNFI